MLFLTTDNYYIVYFMVLCYYMTQEMMQNFLCEHVKIMAINICIKLCKLESCIICMLSFVCLSVCLMSVIELISLMCQEWNRKLSSSELQKTDLDERMQQLFSRHGITASLLSVETTVVV